MIRRVGSPRPLRFAFIGLGFAAEWLHMPAVRAVPSATCTGGFDVSASRRRDWTDRGGGETFDSADDLLARTRPDVVVVSTPPESHARYCMLALEAGAHVLCEKPFASSVDEAQRVIETADRVDRTVAVNHEFRYMPIFARLQETLGSPGVGRPVLLHCVQLMDLPPWNEQVPWRAAMLDRSLFEGGVHLVDLLHMLAGRAPETVFAVTSAGLDPDRRADAIHLVTLDYGDGLLGHITIDRLCRAGTRYVDLRVDCEQASLRASFGGRAFVRIGVKRAERPGVRVDFGLEGLAWLEQGLRRKVLARNPRRATVKATGSLYAATLGAWQRGVEPPTSARIAIDTLRIIEASYRSARTGQLVSLEPFAP
jgi:predicted dehydrogenase